MKADWLLAVEKELPKLFYAEACGRFDGVVGFLPVKRTPEGCWYIEESCFDGGGQTLNPVVIERLRKAKKLFWVSHYGARKLCKTESAALSSALRRKELALWHNMRRFMTQLELREGIIEMREQVEAGNPICASTKTEEQLVAIAIEYIKSSRYSWG